MSQLPKSQFPNKVFTIIKSEIPKSESLNMVFSTIISERPKSESPNKVFFIQFDWPLLTQSSDFGLSEIEKYLRVNPNEVVAII